MSEPDIYARLREAGITNLSVEAGQDSWHYSDGLWVTVVFTDGTTQFLETRDEIDLEWVLKAVQKK